MNVSVVYAGENTLGESAFWSTAGQTLYWIDGAKAQVHLWHATTQTHRAIALPSAPVGMIAATVDPRVLAMSFAQGIALFNVDDRAVTVLAHPEGGREGVGYNDGKVDPAGRLWIGTYDEAEIEQRGCLWVLENGDAPRLADTGMAVVNGPAFSPDGAVMYVSDSIARRILAFDLTDGRVYGRRVFAALAPQEGLPDGLTVDAEGCVWCAHWDGARVTRYSPAGEQLTLLPLPVPRVTSVAFGGAKLDTLYITTARYGLNADQLEQAPDAGALFSANPGVTGIAATPLPLPFSCER